ncbi:MAG: hypothetical protein K2L95_03085 [Alphaproteobacteria bacterium]|nr:hypothetical protein [Alphaproteobacteria bacterium]
MARPADSLGICDASGATVTAFAARACKRQLVVEPVTVQILGRTAKIKTDQWPV